VIANLLPPSTKSLLDLGIGTGLELKAIFNRFADIHVTVMDIAENMLEFLKEKYKRCYVIGQISRLHMSYLDYNYEEKEYDAVISVLLD
jgi:tRNA (cmo5U34)-methyltransferase